MSETVIILVVLAGALFVSATVGGPASAIPWIVQLSLPRAIAICLAVWAASIAAQVLVALWMAANSDNDPSMMFILLIQVAGTLLGTLAVAISLAIYIVKRIREQHA